MRWKQKNGSDAVKGPGMIQGLSLDPAPGVAEGLNLIPSARYYLILSAGLDPSKCPLLKDIRAGLILYENGFLANFV